MDRFQAMRTFAAVVDGGGFAAAARALHLSPPAVTRAIAALEAHLGARLLTRTTRSVRLTEPGAAYLADCRRILAALDEAEAAAGGRHATPRGELMVTAPTQFGRLHVAPLLPAFLVDHPEITVHLHLVDRVVNLVEEGLDVALRIGELRASSLIAVTVGRVRRVVVGAPAYLERMGWPDGPAALDRHTLIAATSVMAGDGWSFSDSGRPFTVRVRARLWTSAPDAAIEAAVQGFGLTRVPIYQVAEPLRAGRLVVVLADHELPPVPVSLVTAEGRRSAAKVRAFIDFATPRLRRILAT